MKQYYILEYMASLGIEYENTAAAWKDFYRWRQKMPKELQPRIVKPASRKLIEVVES